MTRALSGISILLLFIILSIEGYTCSAFFTSDGRMLFGKNFDWSTGTGYLIKNNRGQIKYAYGLVGENQAFWKSEYGSITFNQVGKEFPYGGINERGLVVEQLWLSSSYYQDNNNFTISELEWIQYQLDRFSSVSEVLANINTLTIKPVKARVHYFIADPSGHSAVIDFMEGKAMVHEGASGFQVITNSGYEESLEYYAKFGSEVDKNSRTSADRFCQLSNGLARLSLQNPGEAFKLLDLSAENRDTYKTYWTIVYDLENREIRYKSYDQKTIRKISISDFSYGETDPVLGCDINSGQIKFQVYSPEMNADLLGKALNMMNVRVDRQLANQHQISPGSRVTDSVYRKNYAELRINFKIRLVKGQIFYVLAQGKDNFKRRAGNEAAGFAVWKNRVKTVLYAVPKGAYALALFHDLNNNNKLDPGILGIPREPYAFSNNAKGIFGLPPKYKKAMFELVADTELEITIK